MKKLFLITILIMISGLSWGQNLKKGNLIGTHVMSVTLAPGVTMDQYIEYYRTKVLPEVEKVSGWKGYLVKGIRGENPDSFGIIYVIPTEKDRDKFYNADGTQNDLGKQLTSKMQQVVDELNKLGTVTTKYTDWLVL